MKPARQQKKNHRLGDPIYKGVQYSGGWNGGYNFVVDGTMYPRYATEAACKAAITRLINSGEIASAV